MKRKTHPVTEEREPKKKKNKKIREAKIRRTFGSNEKRRGPISRSHESQKMAVNDL